MKGVKYLHIKSKLYKRVKLLYAMVTVIDCSKYDIVVAVYHPKA